MILDINIKPEISKIIDSFKEDRKSEEKRKDLENEREYRKASNLSKTFGHDKFGEFLEKEADIIKKTKD